MRLCRVSQRKYTPEYYLGHGAVCKLLLPNESLTSHWLCSKISDQNVEMCGCYSNPKT